MSLDTKKEDYMLSILLKGVLLMNNVSVAIIIFVYKGNRTTGY